jgi:hypothetical protein
MSVAAQTWSRTNLRQFAFTIDNIKRREIEHTFSHSPALAMFANETLGDFGGTRLAGRGHKVEGGGHAIVKRVTLGEHAGAARMASDYSSHNVLPDSNTRFAEGTWKFYSHGLAMSGHEARINRGDAAIASFLDSQTKSVMRALANLLADDIYAATSAANAITSIDDLISANDSVHGLSGATFLKYNSRGLDPVGTAPASISFASGSFAAQGLSDMRTSWNNASEGLIQPDVGLTTYAVHEFYEGSLQPQERFAGAVAVADGSFRALAFKGTPVIPDRKCTSGTLFWVSLGGDEGVSLHTLAGADFDFGEWKSSSNQDVMVRPLYLTGTMMIGNRAFGSNKITSITA